MCLAEGRGGLTLLMTVACQVFLALESEVLGHFQPLLLSANPTPAVLPRRKWTGERMDLNSSTAERR